MTEKLEQVLKIEPETELHFKGPHGQVSTEYLKLTNPSENKVCFKIKKSPQRYCFQPNSGIIKPKKSIKIAVTLQPSPSADLQKINELNDKFMFQTFAPDGDVNQENPWKEIDPSVIMETELKCICDVNHTEVNENTDENKETNELNDNLMDESNEMDSQQPTNNKKAKSKFKTGIVYLSKVPPGRNYTRLREIFEKFAPIGNIYLVPDKQINDRLQKKGKIYKCYKEGFVEFKRKKDAKNFTSIFNGASLKSSGSDNFIWDLRYLHRVKWHHVMAKFKLNKAIEEQRLRLETEKARESADHYLEMVNEWKKRGNKEMVPEKLDRIEETLTKKQRKTKNEIKTNKKKDDEMNQLYEKIFG